jgi:hypothetical protein
VAHLAVPWFVALVPAMPAVDVLCRAASTVFVAAVGAFLSGVA